MLRLTLEAGGPCYSFLCLFCVMVVSRPADRRAIALLHAAGVEPEDSSVGYPETRPGGPPFTLDDLLAFHQLLVSSDIVAQVDAWSEDRGGGR